MAIVQTYHTFEKHIRHMLTVNHKSRIRNLAWMMTGIFFSRSVHLSFIAKKIPGLTERRSRTRRISRFLHNGHFRVRDWYKPVAERLLAEAAGSGRPIQLIIDATKVTNNYQLLIVAIAFRRRALPLVWTWIRHKKGHSSGRKQKALLNYVYQLIPRGTEVVLTGDSEFTPLQGLLDHWGWYYALRQKGSHKIRRSPAEDWQRVDELVIKSGQRVWLEAVQLTQVYQHESNFLALWQSGHAEPWLLATNLPSARVTIRHYKRRMWIEEMFGDFKGNGFDLEKSRLGDFLSLSRLTFVVAILYLALISLGVSTIKHGRRHLVDRRERRDLSIFRIGYDILEHYIINERRFSIRFCPYFEKVSGS